MTRCLVVPFLCLLTLSTSCGSERLQARSERRSRAERSGIKFGVVLSTWERPGDPGFRIPCANSLYTIARQSFSNWALFLHGDGLTSEAVGHLFNALDLASIPRHKVVFRNMDASRSERNMHANDTLKSAYYSGLNSIVGALDLAYTTSDITHIAKIDEDDAWSADHLQNLADAYAAVPLSRFAFSMAHTPPNGTLPDILPDTSKLTMTQQHWHLPKNVSIMPPIPCHVVHSAVSWSASLKLTYYGANIQGHPAYRRTMDRCCDRECTGMLWGDADMLTRVHGMVQANEVVSVFVPTLDVFYTGRPETSCLLDALYRGSSNMSCVGIHGYRTDLVGAVAACKMA